jgi:hypothetical protein
MASAAVQNRSVPDSKTEHRIRRQQLTDTEGQAPTEGVNRPMRV